VKGPQTWKSVTLVRDWANVGKENPDITWKKICKKCDPIVVRKVGRYIDLLKEW
jgi:hypothetical protein